MIWLTPRVDCLTGLWVATGLLSVIALGLISLPLPFNGDTAEFLLAAKMIDHGTLYVDFWDMKQPGIYWLYMVAGRLSGFDQLSIREFELAIMVVFSVILIASLWKCFQHRWLAAVVPIAAVGSYYAAATSMQLTQAEFIAAIPIFCSAWLLSNRYTTPLQAAGGYWAAGFFAGVALVFKMVFGLFFAAFFLIAWLTCLDGRSIGAVIRRLVALAVPFAGGVGTVLAAVALVFAADHALGLLIWNTFVFPGLALHEAQMAPVSRLAGSIGWFVLAMAPWLVLTVPALMRVAKRNEPALTRMMAAWLAAGITVILIQRFSWWSYHFLLLIVPVAVLGVRGVDVALSFVSRPGTRRRAFAMAFSLLLLLPAVSPLAKDAAAKGGVLLKTLLVEHQGIEQYRQKVNPEYARVAEDVGALGASAPAGPIYVFGDPLYYLKFDRTQAIAMHGWGWEYAVGEQWRKLAPSLMRAKPAFIYVSEEYRPLIEARSPDTLNLLRTEYEMVKSDLSGTIYRYTGGEVLGQQ